MSISSLCVLYARVPISVQDGSCVPAEEGYLFRDATLFVERDNSKSTSAASFPVH